MLTASYNDAMKEYSWKSNIFEFVGLIGFYLGFTFFPWNFLTDDKWQIGLLQIFSKVALVIAFIIFNMRSARIKREINLKYILFAIPFLIPICSNLLFSLALKGTFISNYDQFYTLTLIDLILGVFLEEWLFRLHFYRLFYKTTNKPWKLILISTLIFSSAHALNFITSDPLAVVVQIGYCLILGAVLGTFMVITHSFTLVFIGHLLFNFLNYWLVNNFFVFEQNVAYYIFSTIIAVFTFVYCGLIYLRWRKNNAA